MMPQNEATNDPTPLVDRLELLFGEATHVQARLYARLHQPESSENVELAGTITGPECLYARTLPATFRLDPRGPANPPLAEAFVPDPCFWTPELPQLYRFRVELRDGAQVVERAERIFGIRPLGVQGPNLKLAWKRWVFRGVQSRSTDSDDLASWHEAVASLYTESPADAVCEEASRVGVLIAAEIAGSAEQIADELRRLSRWPAVGLAVIRSEASFDLTLRQTAPNLLFAQRFAADRPVQPASWAHVAVCDVGPIETLAERIAECQVPIIMLRSAERPSSVSDARALCDRLQRDLAPIGDFAGYVV